MKFDISVELDESIYKELDEQLYRGAYNKTLNEIAHKTVVNLNTGVTAKWFLRINELQHNYFKVASVHGNKSGSRDGVIKLLPMALSLKSGVIDMKFKGTAINLSRFVVNWTPASIVQRTTKKGKSYMRREEPTVQLLRGGVIRQVKGSFVAEMRSGHRGVFQKRANSKHKIVELRTITLPSMMQQVGYDTTFDTTMVDFDDLFNKNFNNQLH